MLSFIFLSLAALHAGVHLMGYSRAYSNVANTRIIHQAVPRNLGIAWLFVCILFIVTGMAYLLTFGWWPYCGLTAIIVSQVMIFTAWKDAKWGTLINIVLLTAIIWDMMV